MIHKLITNSGSLHLTSAVVVAAVQDGKIVEDEKQSTETVKVWRLTNELND